MSEKSLNKNKLVFGLALVASALLPVASLSGEIAPLGDGERVVFLGDSITHGGGYVGWVQLFQSLRNPGQSSICMSSGLSGDTAGGSLRRFERDVNGKKPDRVFVMFGMNDVGHHLYTAESAKKADIEKQRLERISNYEKNMEKVHELIVKAGAKPIYITPTPYDEYSAKPNNPAKTNCTEFGLSRIASVVRKMAKSKGCEQAELFDPFLALMKKHPGRFQGDRVHPGPEGHLLMGAMLFEQTGAPACFEKCEISASQLPYKYSPKAFPLPVGDLYRKVEEVYPLTEKLNQEIFAVKGLGAGKWAVSADGKKLGIFSAEELGKGINLAVLPTPNQLEAQRLEGISKGLSGEMSKLCTFYAMFDRAKVRGGDPENKQSAFDALDGWVKELHEKKNAAATYYANCVKSFKKTYDELPEIKAKIEKQRQELNAARPKAYVISLSKVESEK